MEKTKYDIYTLKYEYKTPGIEWHHEHIIYDLTLEQARNAYQRIVEEFKYSNDKTLLRINFFYAYEE